MIKAQNIRGPDIPINDQDALLLFPSINNSHVGYRLERGIFWQQLPFRSIHSPTPPTVLSSSPPASQPGEGGPNQQQQQPDLPPQEFHNLKPHPPQRTGLDGPSLRCAAAAAGSRAPIATPIAIASPTLSPTSTRALPHNDGTNVSAPTKTDLHPTAHGRRPRTADAPGNDANNSSTPSTGHTAPRHVAPGRNTAAAAAAAHAAEPDSPAPADATRGAGRSCACTRTSIGIAILHDDRNVRTDTAAPQGGRPLPVVDGEVGVGDGHGEGGRVDGGELVAGEEGDGEARAGAGCLVGGCWGGGWGGRRRGGSGGRVVEDGCFVGGCGRWGRVEVDRAFQAEALGLRDGARGDGGGGEEGCGGGGGVDVDLSVCFVLVGCWFGGCDFVGSGMANIHFHVFFHLG